MFPWRRIIHATIIAHAHPRLDRAGGTPRHFAHRGRDPLAAPDPGPALPDVRRRGEGERAGDLVVAFLLRGAGDGVPLRQFLPRVRPPEDRGGDLSDDRGHLLVALVHRRPPQPPPHRL